MSGSPAPMRLQRFLARAGVTARRKAEELIRSGRVEVNGHAVTTLGTRVDPARDRVCVDGRRVELVDPFYVVLNKPKGCVTAVSDPRGRPTVMDCIPGVPSGVVPVGRLDYYSEGVLLLTNDGELADALLHPRREVEKTYHVKIRGEISDRDIDVLRDGVRLDDGTVTAAARVDRLRVASRHHWLVMTVTEGRSRQIHRMAAALGHQVLKLQRVAFAGILYHGLRVGDARELTHAEVNQLRQLAGLQSMRGAGGRGTWHVRREQTEHARRAKQGSSSSPNSGTRRKAGRTRRARHRRDRVGG